MPNWLRLGSSIPGLFTANRTRSDRCQVLLRQLRSGSRPALARAVTLIESSHPGKRAEAAYLIQCLLGERKAEPNFEKATFRIGISGPPGAGKSTFTEALGRHVISLGHRLAVLAVDPSSASSGGSLLGDKTRMPELSRNPDAFVRASPTGGTLGGVERNTAESILLCEAANFDIVLVETVGIGQSELAVANMTDMFCLIIPPAAGDELQGLKKGVVEMADLVVVNKADGDLLPAARRAQAEYMSALKLLRRRPGQDAGWRPRCVRVSSRTGDGIEAVFALMQKFKTTKLKDSSFEEKRVEQKIWSMWNQISHELMEVFRGHKAVKNELSTIERKVRNGDMAPAVGAGHLLRRFRTG